MAKSSTVKVGKTTIKGATDADKQAINAAKAANRADATRTAEPVQVTKRGDQTPEAKTTTKEKTSAADKLFTDADTAARLGLPPEMTREQHEIMARRAATGL